MKSLISAVILFVFLASSLSLMLASKAQGEVHHHRTCRKCVIPKHAYGHDNIRATAKAFAVADVPVTVGTTTRKPFHYRDVNLTLEHLNLNQVGFAMDKETGKVIASGRITHDGGDGGLIGSHVTFRVRAYVSSTNKVIQIPPDAVVVWEAVQKVWVPRGQQVISLVPSSENQNHFQHIQSNFNAITHLELEMEVNHDR